MASPGALRVVLAPDKFAGTLTAVEACEAMTVGWRDASPADHIVARPMSDGGPGFIAALASALGCVPRTVATTGPHGDAVEAQLLLAGGPTPAAYLESAQCCGLDLAPHPRRPLEASSSGLVALLEAALDAGARRVVVGVGGTASTDGGRPVVEALAGRWPDDVELVLAADVEHPLLGPAGAARSFAPQKGATDDEVQALELRLAAWASSGEMDPSSPGAGAGGGLGYGLLRLGARKVGGAEVVAKAIGLADEIVRSDLVVTGEGRVDFSSLRGKVVGHVASQALGLSRPCVVLAGDNQVGRREAASVGVDEIYTLVDFVGAEAAMASAADSVRRLAIVVAKDWSRG